jgi:hypothetical protein
MTGKKRSMSITQAQVTRGTYRLGSVVPAHEPEVVLASPTRLKLVVLAEENDTAALVLADDTQPAMEISGQV